MMTRIGKMTSYIAMTVFAATAFTFSSCDKEEATPDAPAVTEPALTAIQVGAAKDLSFTISAPGGYKTAEVTATGGTVAKKSEPASGAKTGAYVATFTADNTAGAAEVVLKVTDNNSKVTTSKATLNKSISAPPTVALSASTAEAKPGKTVTVTVTVNAENGPKSLTVSGASTDPAGPFTLSGATSATKDVVIMVPANAVVGSKINVSFSATDNQNLNSSTSQLEITVLDPTVYITEALSGEVHWTADNKYVLKGNIYVQDGSSLTIDPGTVIFGDKVTKGALIVSRGGKIHATGTAEQPIVFTSSAPKTFRNYGDWGGVVLLGRAQNNQNASQQIEGISAASGDNGLYGGTDDADNSGELQYVRIEFAGIALSTDNELNGLTFGSVGSGTKVDHIQVSYSGDDSFEWFGGTVNTHHLIAYRGWDDEFDTDFGYRGKNQFLVSFRDPNIADKSGSNGFESDNDALGDTKTPQTAATFANVTFFGPYMFANTKATSSSDPTPILNTANVNANYKRGAHIRRNSALKVYNCVFAGANIDGIFFEQASSAAVFKGNFVGRISGLPLPPPVANTVADSYDATNFATENTILAPKDKIDLNDVFAGANAKFLWSIAAPSALLSANSALLTAGVDISGIGLPANGFDSTVKYVGAFDATTNWAAASWTNYDPNNTEY
jgi:hypothetical protein